MLLSEGEGNTGRVVSRQSCNSRFRIVFWQAEAIARVLGSDVEFRALTEAMLKDRDGGYLRCRNVLWVARCFPFGWFSKELTTV
jgi:hypothetical protein